MAVLWVMAIGSALTESGLETSPEKLFFPGMYLFFQKYLFFGKEYPITFHSTFPYFHPHQQLYALAPSSSIPHPPVLVLLSLAGQPATAQSIASSPGPGVGTPVRFTVLQPDGRLRISRQLCLTALTSAINKFSRVSGWKLIFRKLRPDHRFNHSFTYLPA